ncbi:MAG: SAM-dependent methyltransferase [Clostridiales bacterium]|nr:SAM-dependent methyltransferase [Clostridiales bacterium]
MSQFIFTCQPESTDLALGELRRADSGVCVSKWVEPGVGIAVSGLGFRVFSQALRAAAPVFTRHICPVDMEFSPGGLSSAAEKIKNLLPPDGTFSVQVRAFPGRNAGDRRAASETIGAALEEMGFCSDRAEPAAIVSVMLGDTVYAGVSSPEDNLSSWPGGMRRFARTESTASRAEFKLLEALELFGEGLPSKGKALDLGAAPGGWTRVLAEKCFSVTAVDPAELSPDVLRLPGVTHFRGTSQQFLETSRGQFDVVVNDMKLDIPESARVMAECAGLLAPGGLAVMTFKLKPKKWTAQINSGLSVLERAYSLVGLRQLFHNRSEVTAVLTPLR